MEVNDATRLKAYFLWEAAGSPPGEAQHFWLEAELATKSQSTTAALLCSEIDADLTGWEPKPELAKGDLLALCKVLDFWIAPDTLGPIAELGLDKLAAEIRKDYVVCCYLAWRREYKYAYISLRSFLESFCLLLYYMNQGFERALYLKGEGYKYMLHRMVQKKQAEDTHAFRKHFELLLRGGIGGEAYAVAFFKEIVDLYDIMSKAVHGDFSAKPGQEIHEQFRAVLCRSLQACNTLALYDSVFDATQDELALALDGVLSPVQFEKPEPIKLVKKTK
jgi:hypothetical protein